MSDDPGRLPSGGMRLPGPLNRAELEKMIENASASVVRGNTVVVGNFDRAGIPTDPLQRVLQVPIPLSRETHRPCYDRRLLMPEERVRLRLAHEAKIDAALRDRAALLQRVDERPSFAREVNALCREDPVFWINHFVWTTDPRDKKGGDALPFVLFDAQEREARFYHDVFCKADEMLWVDEKSRAWGWTWLHIAALTLHGWLFEENHSVLIGGATAPDVDDGGLAATHESHFGKIRFILRHLPAWQVPEGILQATNLNKLFTLQHPTKQANLIKGRQYCDNWGRGHRFRQTKADEAAWALAYRAATLAYGNTSRLNHVGSTPKGLDNEYARIVHGDEEKVVRTLPWMDNPNLTVEDYWAWRKKYGWEKTAQERDIDYMKSASSAILLDFDRNFHVVTKRPASRAHDGSIISAREDLDYDPLYPLWLTVDPGMDDAFALIWLQPAHDVKELRIVDFLQASGRPGPFYVPFILGYKPTHTLEGEPWPYEYDEIQTEMIVRHSRWKFPSAAFGDRYGSDASSRMSSGRTLYETWALYGCPGVYPVKILPNQKDEAVQRLVAALPRIRIAARLLTQKTGGRESPTLVECFEQYSWVVGESPSGRKLKREPKHDKYCHAMDALMFPLKCVDANDPKSFPTAPPDLRSGRPGQAGYLRAAPPDTPEARPRYDERDDDYDPISEAV